MSELAKEKLYRKELIKAGATGDNNVARIRSLAGGGASSKLQSARAKAVVKAYSDFENKTWINQPNEFYGWKVWTDGENIYCSNGIGGLVLDKEVSEWKPISFNIKVYPDHIWTDGENIYYVNDSGASYVFNKSSKKFEPKTWNIRVYADNVWTDGENIYCYSGRGYILNTNDMVWEEDDVTNYPSNFVGNNVWTDGENIYYSSNGSNAIFNKNNKNWEGITFTGLSRFTGTNVWTDGRNIYYSDGNSHYILNKGARSWGTAPESFGYFTGNNVWTDGDNVYISYNNYQMVRHVTTGINVHK